MGMEVESEGKQQELTAGAEVVSECSGKHWIERGGERDLRWPATKMMKMASMQGLRRGVAGRRG